jgi:hypothetical protein
MTATDHPLVELAGTDNRIFTVDPEALADVASSALTNPQVGNVLMCTSPRMHPSTR